MRNNTLGLAAVFIGLIFYSGCNRKQSVQEETTVAVKPFSPGPDFNADSAYSYVEHQVQFGPRIPNSPQHKACSHYLHDMLTRFGASVVVQEFTENAYDGQELSLYNIIASMNPGKPRKLLLAAHWDTRPFADKDTVNQRRPFDGANDGASGAAILLEIARTLSANVPPEVGIDILLFDGEDYGEPEFDANPENDNSGKTTWCLGSQYWSKNPHQKNYSAYYGILLDMVGARNAKFYKEGASVQFAKKVTDRVWHIAEMSGYSNYFINAPSPGITDDHIFINRDAHIPTLDIVDYDPGREDSYFPSYHHTHQDNMDIIDKNTLRAVGQTVVNVIYNE